MLCRICDNSQNNIAYETREMMFGFKDPFTYFQCSKCNCLQIKEIPSNISKYYPENYYSFTPPVARKAHGLRKKIAGIRNHYAVFRQGLLGKIIYRRYPEPILDTLSKVRLNKKSAILDVGCGSGNILYNLRELGFQNLLGIDPFVRKDIQYDNGLKILKKSIADLNNKWDLIMFHHSFEHMADPLETLSIVSNLLNPGGTCMLAIPKVPCHAWTYYGVNWVQLDPPRHFFIHSPESIKILAAKSNLKLESIYNNSTAFQFWGSEQYKHGITLFGGNSYAVNPGNSIFNSKDISNFEKQAKQLNKTNQGDAGVFYLKKSA